MRHASTTRVKIATSNAGKIWCCCSTSRPFSDGGAYGARKKPAPGVTARASAEAKPYNLENMLDGTQLRRVYQHRVPAAFLRTPGDLQIIFALESMTDIVAHELRIDPVEFRLLNAIGDGDTDIEGNPYTRDALCAKSSSHCVKRCIGASRCRPVEVAGSH